MNCCFAPWEIDGLDGVTAIDTSVAGVTVSVVEPDMLPDDALIVVVPAATVAAKPELFIVAMPVFDELQVTAVVRFCVVLSENVPVAANCLVVPLAMLGLDGVTAMDTSVAGVTVSVSDPDMLPDVAVIVVEPAATATAMPELFIVAMPVFDELQVT